MVTLAELRTEAAWHAEFQPPELARLCQRLRSFYGVGPLYIGSKGDERHLRGYHRSARWIHTSRFCTNRTYSVTETPGNRTPGDENWLCAIDMTIPRAQLISACARLDTAVRAGRLEKITEWYGNDDGDTRVDGYDNIRNVVAISDDSHLWHLHLSLDRDRVDRNHDDLYVILTGGDMSAPEVWSHDIDPSATNSYSAGGALWVALQRTGVMQSQLPALASKLDQVLALLASQPDDESGVSEARIREIIREELDRTRLSV